MTIGDAGNEVGVSGGLEILSEIACLDARDKETTGGAEGTVIQGSAGVVGVTGVGGAEPFANVQVPFSV